MRAGTGVPFTFNARHRQLHKFPTMFSRRTDQSRLASKLSLESLLETASDAVFRLDRNGKIFYASHRAHQVLGAGGDLAGAPALLRQMTWMS